METFCTSIPHSKHRAALTSTSFYQPSSYSRNLRQNDYTLPSRNRHSNLLWHQRTQQNNIKPKSKISSIVLAAAAFMVFVTVLGIAGLAFYMGALQNEPPSQLVSYSCSAKILRGDKFTTNLQEKARKYKQQLENLYRKSSIGPSMVSCIFERFGNDSLTINFGLTFHRKKIPKTAISLEKTIKDILLTDAISRRPLFRNIRFDPRSIQIRQLSENESFQQRISTLKPKDSIKPKPGVLVKPVRKYNLTVTAEIPVKKKTPIEEIDFKEEDLPVIQGSFHISKTEADITEKKENIKSTTTQRPKTSEKIQQTSTTLTTKTTTSTEKSTTTEISTSTSFVSTINNFLSKITTNSPITTKQYYTTNLFAFTIPPHSLNQEPWIPIHRTTEIKFNPTVPVIQNEQPKQPIYTSFTNPSLSFHWINTEPLGSTGMIGHPIPVNKIITNTEESIANEDNYSETVISTTDDTELALIAEASTSEREISDTFVEIETVKHIPGVMDLSTSEIPPMSNWKVIDDTHLSHNKSELIQPTLLTNISSIFQNLASSLDIIPTTSSSATEAQILQKHNENVEEMEFGEGHAEVIAVDEDLLALETQSSTKFPLVTLIPVKSNSGIGRPLRPKPKRTSNSTNTVENRSFPNDPFIRNVAISQNPLNKFIQTEVVTSVSSEVKKIKINKNKLNDFNVLGILNFEDKAFEGETTTLQYSEINNREGMSKKSVIDESELIRSAKIDSKDSISFTTPSSPTINDEVSVLSVNSTISINNKKIKTLTVEELKKLSEMSKLNTNSTVEKPLISNKAISSSYTTNKAGLKILTKIFNKIPSFAKDNEESLLGFNIISLTNNNANKTECNNYTVKCGDGQCLPETTRCNQLLDCNDGTDEQNCNCADYLKSQYLLRKICDGVVDCWDFSDENLCDWCNPDQYVCSNSKVCIDTSKICDGTKDCPNGDDERQCVTVAPAIEMANRFLYYTEGYLLVRQNGLWGKLCMDNLKQVVHRSNSPWKIADLGQTVCEAMTYKNLGNVTSIVEVTDVVRKYQNERYYEISNTTYNIRHSQLSFKESTCATKEIVKIQCQSLECGTRPQAINQLSRRMYRIVGGGNAGLGAWPWQAALYKEGEFQCGGTLLTDRWLLSAGHCFYHSLDEHWVARMGALRRGTALPSPYEQLRPITQIILHPNYVDIGFINDISLLKTESNIIFSDYVRPICLPPTNNILKDGRICTVIGWGQLFEVGRIFPDTLQEVQVPIISTEECRKHTLFLPLYKITDDMFCAGYERGGRDACLGDSGGPLMCSEPNGRWTLYGVTSNGYGCARANRPGVYTKVANYVNWIQSYINNNTEKDTNTITKTTCTGHRCPLGECLPKSRLCNGFIECSDGSDEINCAQNI